MNAATTATPLQTVESVYSAFGRGDTQAIVDMVAPNAIWRQSPMLPWGGDFRGPEGAKEFFAKLLESTEPIAFVADENVVLGNEVFTFGSYSAKGRASGKTGTAKLAFRWKVDNGRIVSYDSYVDSAAMLAILS